MNTITIPDPAEVGAMLDKEFPPRSHTVSWERGRFSTIHWFLPSDYFMAVGETPEALVADIRRLLGERDPIAKLRKQAETLGFSLRKLADD